MKIKIELDRKEKDRRRKARTVLLGVFSQAKREKLENDKAIFPEYYKGVPLRYFIDARNAKILSSTTGGFMFRREVWDLTFQEMHRLLSECYGLPTYDD